MNKKGFTLIEALIILAILGIIAAAAVDAAIEHDRIQDQCKVVIINLFNGQELKSESWMLELSPNSWFIHEVAREWCRNHSIPSEQVDVKVKELVTAFDNAIANIKIKLSLPPAVIIESNSTIVLPEATFP